MEMDFGSKERPRKSVKVAKSDSQTPKTKAEKFHTPEEVAALDKLDKVDKPLKNLESAAKPLKSIGQLNRPPAWKQDTNWYQKLRDKLDWQWPPGRRESLIIVIVVVVFGSLAALILQPGAKPAASATKSNRQVKKPAAPTTVPSTLTGLPVAPSVNQKPVTGVMIENSLQARPQASLSQAGVVFEAIAEGGITRFLALYQDTSPDNVGPIRSARPYYEEWALGFDAGYAHVGGSPEALADLKAWGVRDLDEFANSGAYHRIAGRAAPHNVYTSIAALNQLEAAKGWTTSNYTGFARGKEAPSQTPNAKVINLALSGALYNVHYEYSRVTNSYYRSEGGAPHIDANSNTQLTPKVVIALIMPYGLEGDGYHSSYNTLGSGTAYIFQDGMVTTGQWNKATVASQFSFTDSGGQPILLNPGQTWLTALGSLSNVNYLP